MYRDDPWEPSDAIRSPGFDGQLLELSHLLTLLLLVCSTKQALIDGVTAGMNSLYAYKHNLAERSRWLKR